MNGDDDDGGGDDLVAAPLNSSLISINDVNNVTDCDQLLVTAHCYAVSLQRPGSAGVGETLPPVTCLAPAPTRSLLRSQEARRSNTEQQRMREERLQILLQCG